MTGPVTRKVAATQLGELGEAAAVEPLVEALADPLSADQGRGRH